jgi:hypothetical protein
MTMLHFDNPRIEHPALAAFAAFAGRFCELVESRSQIPAQTFIHALHAILPDLYGAGLRLPGTDVLYNGVGDKGRCRGACTP